MRLLKTKASFQMFVLIVSTFSVVLLTEPVSAEQTYCCEKTIFDQYCQQAPLSQCDPGYGAQQGSCQDTGFCASVCCLLEDSCAANTGAAQCRAQGGVIDAGNPTCEGISACQEGCCQLGSQCFLSTESACQNLADQFPGTSGLDVWREEITTESACLAVCQSGDLGCCVDVDSGCSYTARDICGQQGGSFYSGVYCSDPDLFGQCACTPHAEQRCVGDGAYWFDSCGSMEEKIDTCVYANGEVCKEDGDTASCGSVDCPDTTDFLFNTHDPNIGGPRKNGESWCVYEGKVGPGNDLVGSRHYLFSCINGEERVFEQCRDFREEMCVQLLPEEPDGLSVAQCVSNDGYACVQDCNEKPNEENYKTNKACCEQYTGSCAWIEEAADVPQGNISRGYGISEDEPFSLRTVRSNPAFAVAVSLGQTQIHHTGVCMPVVPPGLAFDDRFEQGPSYSADDVCNVASSTCTSVHVKKLSGYKCKVNCECETEEWLRGMNDFCVSLGDCGASYNVAGTLTLGGQDASGDLTSRLTSSGFSPFSDYRESGDALTSTYSFDPETGKATLNGVEFATVELSKISGAAGAVGATLAALATYTSVLEGTLLGTLGALSWMPWVAVGLVAFYAFVKLLGLGKKKEYVHTFECLPWQAPRDEQQCERCAKLSADGTCTEYKCLSLGQSCTLINGGTSEEQCITQHPNDISYPSINPWYDIVDDQFSFDPLAYGYAVTYHGDGGPAVPYFTPISIGIQLDEPAVCKYDTVHTGSFDDMASFFDGHLFTQQKRMSVLESPGNDVVYYVRCQDHAGNPQPNEYAIQFTISPEPDWTTPMILWTEPVNSFYARHGVSAVDVRFFLTEPAECRWSTEDQTYDAMPVDQDMACTTDVLSSPVVGDYSCLTSLDAVDDADVTYFIRCQDVSENLNTNQESYEYTIRGTTDLGIVDMQPQGTVTSSEVEVTLTTADGAEEGSATCQIKGSGIPHYVDMATTQATVHRQLVTLDTGRHVFEFLCQDLAGNTAYDKLVFEATLPEDDQDPPELVHVYTSGSTLHVVTNEPATCRYDVDTLNFLFEDGQSMGPEGTEHAIIGSDPDYFVQCRDTAQNLARFVIYR